GVAREDSLKLYVAMLSVHTCPLAALGGKETGGMNVYVREVSREVGRMGVSVDVFTRSQDPSIPRVVQLGERARVIHLAAGVEAPMARERVYDHLDEFVEGIEAWRIAEAIDYDLIHAHYWLSGVAALALKTRWSVPVLQMFHTLGRLKNRVARSAAELEPAVRVEEETRIVSEADRIVAANVVSAPSSCATTRPTRRESPRSRAASTPTSSPRATAPRHGSGSVSTTGRSSCGLAGWRRSRASTRCSTR